MRKKRRRFKKARCVLQAACLAVGLTVAGWGSGPAVDNAEATIEVSGTISPNTSLSDIWVIYSLNSSAMPVSIYLSEADDVAGGDTGTFSFLVNDNPDWYDGESYTIMGVYDEDGDGQGDSVCVGGPGINTGDTWDTIFYESEETVVGWLQDDDTGNLRDFYGYYFDTIAQDIGSDIPLWNFSDATANGHAHADSQVVPIPGAAWLLGSSLIGLLVIRRRKKS